MVRNDAGHHDSPDGRGEERARRFTATRRSMLRTALGGAVMATGTLAACSADAVQPTSAGAPEATKDASSGDRLVMLGTNGGPILYPGAAKPGIALVTGGVTYLVDCGFHTAQQLVEANIGLGGATHVFITHRHFDHTSGLPALVMHSWVARPPRGKLRVWGPPQTTRDLHGIRQSFAQDIAEFEKGMPPLPAITGHDVLVPSTGRPVAQVMEDDNVRVEATRVFHGAEIANCYAYRFTIKASGRTVVFSGDTAAPDRNLVNLAQDCDVLVHEVQDNERIEVMVEGLPPAKAEALKTHLYESHSNVIDVPGVAKAAGAGRLVFCHYGPDASLSPKHFHWKADRVARQIGYPGKITAPADLDAIPL